MQAEPAPLVEVVPTRAEAKPDKANTPEPQPFCAKDGRVIERKGWRYCKREGVLDGGFEHRADGAKVLEGRVAAGHVEGLWTAYWRNGKKKWEVPFAKGREEGALKLFYDDGSKRGLIDYKEGQRDGDIKLFHSNGSVSLSGSYAKGKRVGTWTYFHDNGQRSHEIKYTNGTASVHKHWDERGKPVGDKIGRLARTAIVAQMQSLHNEVSDCYMQSRILDKAEGKVVVRFIIGYSGDVSDVDVYNEGFRNDFIDRCTKRAVELLRFPKNPYGPLPIFKTFALSTQ